MIAGLVAAGGFAAFLLAVAVVTRRRGVRASFIESWAFEPGETVLWRDDRADVLVVPRMGVAPSVARLHRAVVVATERRVIVAQRTLTGKGKVTQVLEHGAAADAGGYTGGLFRAGFETRVLGSGAVLHEGRTPAMSYVALSLDPAVLSSTNVAEIRIYSEAAAGFPGVTARS